MRWPWMRVMALLMGGLLAACGGGGGGGASSGLVIEMGDLYFKPNVLTAKPGQTLEITLENKGALEHNFVLYDQDGKTVLFERDNIQPGRAVKVTVKVPEKPGNYEIVCTVPGHKEGGMVATLRVQP
ncbi:MAG: hypothetical protein C4313_10575 [Thermoflexus sp.]|uniref:cupredoxin domain-containing protein n=1 Tax=Thermoflexus sp. TaxID=1969742 RepID=UPI00332BE296